MIEFIAQNGRNKAKAGNAREAVRLFLEQHKNRTFSVAEYRGGVHTSSYYLDEPNPDSNQCFYRYFKSRAEAKRFAEGEAA